MVLLVYWNLLLSWRAYFHSDFAVCKKLHNWRQSGRCNRDTWRTPQSNYAPTEKLGGSRRSAMSLVQKWICGCVSLLLFVHRWLWHDLSATEYVHFFSLLTGLLWYESMEFSTKEKLLWFIPSCFDGVEDRRRNDTCSILWYVLQARKTQNSRRCLFQYDYLHVAHLVHSATSFCTEDHFTFDKSLRMDFAHDPIFYFSNFSLISFIFTSFCKPASWSAPSVPRSISNCGFLSRSG